VKLVVLAHQPLDASRDVVGPGNRLALRRPPDNERVPFEQGKRRRDVVPLGIRNDLQSILLVDPSDGGKSGSEIDPDDGFIRGAHWRSNPIRD
jgi:hypothetical protein